LPMRNHAQWRTFIGPNLVVSLGGFARPCAQDDAVEDRLPRDPRDFDYSGVAQELGEIAPNGARLGRVGRAQVDQENADSGHHAAIGSNGRVRMRLPLPVKIALATAGARIVVPRPLSPPG